LNAPARVLVADDEAEIREIVREAIEADPRFTVVALAGDAADAVRAALRERPDLAVLDMRMPGGGAAAAGEITARLPGTRAVMLSGSRHEDDVSAALRAGASGYLLKDMPFTELCDRLAAVLDGEMALAPELAARLP
jgi:DNA-binding NarL/FixJ family response regulator